MINRQTVLYETGIGTAAVAILLLYYFLDARTVPFPRCPFYLLTHIYCPGCGSQRALSALLHGQVAQALHYNLLLVAAFPLLLYAAWLRLTPSGLHAGTVFYKPAFAWAVLTVVVLFGVLRNISVYPFTLLAPAH